VLLLNELLLLLLLLLLCLFRYRLSPETFGYTLLFTVPTSVFEIVEWDPLIIRLNVRPNNLETPRTEFRITWSNLLLIILRLYWV